MSPDRNTICAVYTRKSSEEGLEQSFNSLDAQREACEAFIVSQGQEGWRVLSARYDDGGFSGGTLQRPALRRLLADVEAGKVDVIVVYKVDRLTRSLADFAKIVETLDSKGVSFVSVTQQFNTTSSMGRLTLNVLLSFAQFEREVTGERIRDKIAASKKKGMWMGGLIPLGYDLEGRKLVPNQREATLACKIFSLYLELGCVSKLAAQLARERVKSKVWITRIGARRGGGTFSRGALYDLLRNRLYIGEIRHRDKWYPGEHKGIIPSELWSGVQAQLTNNLRRHRNRVRERSSSLLTGMLEDASGDHFTPSFTIKNGRRYRYYVSQLAINNPGERPSGVRRLPATEVENLVCARLRSFLASDEEVFDQVRFEKEGIALIHPLVAAAKKLSVKWPSLRFDELRILLVSFLQRVIVDDANIEIVFSRTNLRRLLANAGQLPVDLDTTRAPSAAGDLIRLRVQAERKRCGGEVHLVIPRSSELTPAQPRSALVKAVVRAHSWYERVLKGQALGQRSLARGTDLTERYVGKVFACAFLAPDIVEAILQGCQPRDLTFDKLTRNVPLSWVEQRKQFGFPGDKA
jgi:site-specific DNA recombinase